MINRVVRNLIYIHLVLHSKLEDIVVLHRKTVALRWNGPFGFWTSDAKAMRPSHNN